MRVNLMFEREVMIMRRGVLTRIDMIKGEYQG